MINTLRHINIFNPEKEGLTDIAVIGCGAIGSRVAMELIRLGIKSFTVYDFDEVSDVNISNQAFDFSQIGKNKAEALRDVAKSFGCEVKAITTPLTKETTPHNIVFMCADSMELRQDIIRKWLPSPQTSVIIETRMSFDEVRIYTLFAATHARKWFEVSSYKTEEAEESVCGSKSSVGATAGIAAMFAIWQFINMSNEQEIANELIITTNPQDMISTIW